MVVTSIDLNVKIVHGTLAAFTENSAIIFDLRRFNKLLSFCSFLVLVIPEKISAGVEIIRHIFEGGWAKKNVTASNS